MFELFFFCAFTCVQFFLCCLFYTCMIYVSHQMGSIYTSPQPPLVPFSSPIINIIIIRHVNERKCHKKTHIKHKYAWSERLLWDTDKCQWHSLPTRHDIRRHAYVTWWLSNDNNWTKIDVIQFNELYFWDYVVTFMCSRKDKVNNFSLNIGFVDWMCVRDHKMDFAFLSFSNPESNLIEWLFYSLTSVDF